jgi:hypothetical protein
MRVELVASCGMNCRICSGYLSLQNNVKSKGIRMSYCAGCRLRDKKSAFLKKRCNLLLDNRIEYCYECDDFPCKRLQYIDKRYRNYYKMSMIENLEYIRKHGIKHFLEKEKKKWRCPECSRVLCCHNGICFSCGHEKLLNKKKLYRWEDSYFNPPEQVNEVDQNE